MYTIMCILGLIAFIVLLFPLLCLIYVYDVLFYSRFPTFVKQFIDHLLHGDDSDFDFVDDFQTALNATVGDDFE